MDHVFTDGSPENFPERHDPTFVKKPVTRIRVPLILTKSGCAFTKIIQMSDPEPAS